jgi:predicted RNase H-like nuclease
MRSIWAVVVACLVAVAGVRPIERAAHDRNRDHGARLVAANTARAVLARRDRDHRPDLQLPAAMLPELAAAAPPRVAIDLVLQAARVASVSAPRTPRSSRGPPRA